VECSLGRAGVFVGGTVEDAFGGGPKEVDMPIHKSRFVKKIHI
jgi:hypothetical protein